MDIRLPIMAAVALLCGPFLFWRGFRTLRTVRLIENTPTARIRSMAMGLVEVSGQVRARSAVLAPFTGQACAYWQVEIAARGRRGGWTTLHRKHSGNPFFIEDQTGVALVYPDGAECRLKFGHEEDCIGFAPPEPYASYLRDNPGIGLGLARLSTLRFRERTLDEGQRIYVLGTAVPRSRAFVISEGEELAATGTGGLGERRLRVLDHEACATIRRGENERTFLISQESERELALGMKLRMAAMILGGPPLTLFGLGYWLLSMAHGRWPH